MYAEQRNRRHLNGLLPFNPVHYTRMKPITSWALDFSAELRLWRQQSRSDPVGP